MHELNLVTLAHKKDQQPSKPGVLNLWVAMAFGMGRRSLPPLKNERKALKEEDKDIGQPGPSATKRPRRF
uniref:Uncharacterized protein n=1 Tax=Timema douglasi TaxID=61478 RepID=A0A7R8VTF3_TIMDO|nr:unnamed protein product [Timema douglasi]